MTRTTRATRGKVLQDRTNRVDDDEVPKQTVVTKRQRNSTGGATVTAQQVDEVPNTRMTRRQSREKEEKDKVQEMLRSSSEVSISQNKEEEDKKTSTLLTSASTGALPVTTKAVASKKTTAKSTAATKKETADNKRRKSTENVEEISSSKSSASSSNKKAKTNETESKPATSSSEKVEAKVSSGKAASKSSSRSSVGSSTETSESQSSAQVSTLPVPATKKAPSRRKLKRTDPAQCLEIIGPMYDLYYQQEEDYLLKPYMASQKDINNRMRGILVDWLVEVHYKFRLQTTTLWLCINLLDRYLEKKPLMRNRLQLLGVTCLLVACKFEEIYPPEVHDCVFVTDNAYSRDEVLSMEQSILSVLDYQLCVPTGYHFLTRYLNIINANERMRHMAFYYAERNLQESVSMVTKPSLLVSAALYAALVYDMQDIHRYDSDDDVDCPYAVWPDLLIEETGFDESDLIPIARLLLKHVAEEPVTTSNRRLIAAKKKYLNDKFFNVAELALPSL